jgi:hypothetical protein
MESRKEELRQQREGELRDAAARQDGGAGGGGGGFGSLWFLDSHEPNETQKAALSTIEDRVAELLGAPRESLVGPTAEVTCVRDRAGNRLRAYEELSGTGVHLAVQDDTAALNFDLHPSGSPRMAAGDAVLFPLDATSHLPSGDWRVSLNWKTRPE